MEWRNQNLPSNFCRARLYAVQPDDAEVRGLLRLIFSGDHLGGAGTEPAAVCHPVAEPINTDVNRCELVVADAHRVSTPCPFPTRRWADPA